MPIRFLPPELRERIAAGEVIERPASVVKELIENALDAGAHQIAVDIRGGGYGAIRVVDDGAGIPADELPLAVARHATSKLWTPADFARLETLGYRGEALASIAAVADLTISSRVAAAAVGATITVRGGESTGAAFFGGPPGTSVVVRDLFFNVPARRGPAGIHARETSRIRETVTTYALVHPATRVRLASAGSPIFETSGQGIRDAIAAVLGLEAARHLMEVRFEDPAISGYLSPPGLTRSDRRQLVIAVNGRPIRNPLLVQSVEDAYRSLLPRGRHPFGVLAITIPRDDIDANVHPAKLEIRLPGEPAIAQALGRAVEDALARRLASPAWPRRATIGLIGEQSSFESAVAEEAEPYEAGPPDLATLRPVGQIDESFVVAVGPDGLYLVDQHRAHERVLYDQLQRSGGQLDLLSEIPIDEPADARHERLALAACKSAIKAGRSLDPAEQIDLLNQLASADYPTTCPHGSPTVLRFDNRFIRRQFGRR